MSVNGQNRDGSGAGGTLHWSGRVVTADGLRQSLNGERELVVTPRTVITPLAADHLRTNGVQVICRDESAKPQARDSIGTGNWGYALERPDSLADSAMQSLKREGIHLQEVAPSRKSESLACGLAREAADAVSHGECSGAVVFCLDPLLVCCIANKTKGIRAAAPGSPAQASRAVKTLGVNFLALEIGKQTFFELRQIVRCVCGVPGTCPETLAGVLKELEGSSQCPSTAHGSQPVGSEHKCQCGGGHAHR
jgi:ribose 5-phosphate isomerase RpiB